MADAYGGISMATSDDCVVNATALVDVLNDFRWDNSSGNWVTCKEGMKDEFWYEDSWIQYPTTRPEQIVAVIVEQENGEQLRIPVDVATEDDWENQCDSESDLVQLKTISEIFSPHIVQGWIEIACCANEKGRYVYFESLRIHSDGKVESRKVISGVWATPSDAVEIYNPAS